MATHRTAPDSMRAFDWRRTGRIVEGLIAVFIFGGPIFLAGAAFGEGNGVDAGFGNQGVDVGGWQWDSGAGKLIALPPDAVASDPFQYKFELQCHLGRSEFDTPCLAGRMDCTNGPDGTSGMSGVWQKAPAGVPDPTWTFHSGPMCLFAPRPEDLLPQIAAMIQTEFHKLPITAGTLTAQPSPNTLRGAETNFFAAAAEQQFDVTLLGQHLHVTAKPVQYTWNYGDGTAVGPYAAAGGPLPEDRWGERTSTSHVYTQTGDFSAVLTTHFKGTYSVNGGPPLPIPGQGQFSSQPQQVSVWRSITRNYADTCLQNPQGQGCPGAAPGVP